MAPSVFAAESRASASKTRREMAEFTHQIIGRVLERQPRVRLNFK
jgi:hypothetical protein